MYPDNCLLLVDTYDTVHSGIPNAIRVFKELREAGHEPVVIFTKSPFQKFYDESYKINDSEIENRDYRHRRKIRREGARARAFV